MKYDAVIFDLFGTLVDSMPRAGYEQLLADMSDLVGVPRGDFARVWVEKADDRVVGRFGRVEGTIAAMCEAAGFSPDTAAVSDAARIRVEFMRRTLRPRPNALEMLRSLRSLGLKIGLVTDCSDEVPTLWSKTPFAELIDYPVFSCSVGIKKPDPRIYHLVSEGLGVAPRKCLYVGDGGSDELAGASRVRMDAVLILQSGPDGWDHLRGDARRWTGPALSDLGELIALVHGG